MVLLEMQNGKKIEIKLYPEKAPKTVENFLFLAKKGFYNGLTFHRVINGFMIQGGCPIGDGTGGPGHTIKGEFGANGCYSNDIQHRRGVISMARAQDFNSAGSQFFIVHQDANFLDGQYAAFGEVTKGMDIVDEIAGVDTDRNDRPLKKLEIKSISIKEEIQEEI